MFLLLIVTYKNQCTDYLNLSNLTEIGTCSFFHFLHTFKPVQWWFNQYKVISYLFARELNAILNLVHIHILCMCVTD